MARPIRKVPWLAQRDGIYYATWYDAEARKSRGVSLRTRDPDEAGDRFSAFLSEGRRLYADRNNQPDLTVEQALDAYFDEHVGSKCADIGRQRSAIAHLKAFFGRATLASIDIVKSRDYAAARRGGEIGGGKRRSNKVGGDSTIRRELAVLTAAANHALKWRRILPNQMPSIERPLEHRHDAIGEGQWFTPMEVKALFDAATGDLRHFVRICYYTGARRRSIEKLELAQVDLANGTLRLAKVGERRTKKRRPTIPVHEAIRADLEALIASARAVGSPWLFGAPRDRYREFRGLCERCGLNGRHHPHMLRHSRATHLLQRGVPIYAVARLLGDTVTTIDRVYGHHSPEALAEIIGDE